MSVVHAIQPARWQASVADLGEMERLYLWAVRTWAMGLTRRVEVQADLRGAFGCHRLEDAIPDFDALMMSLAVGADRSIGIRLRRATVAGRDELILIRALAAQIRGEGDLVRALLNLLCRGAVLRIALGHLERLAAAFAAAALVPEPLTPPHVPGRGAGDKTGHNRAGHNVVRFCARRGGRTDAA